MHWGIGAACRPSISWSYSDYLADNYFNLRPGEIRILTAAIPPEQIRCEAVLPESD